MLVISQPSQVLLSREIGPQAKVHETTLLKGRLGVVLGVTMHSTRCISLIVKSTAINVVASVLPVRQWVGDVQAWDDWNQGSRNVLWLRQTALE